MYTMENLIESPKVGKVNQDVIVPFSVNATEASVLTLTGNIDVRAGISEDNRVSCRVYHSYGDNIWQLMEPLEEVNISASGNFVWQRKPSNFLTGPQVKVVFSVDIPGEFELTSVRYSSLSGEDSFSFASGIESVAGNGYINTNIKYAGDADALTFEYPSDSIDVIKYRKGGVTGDIVETKTLTYTDASKDRLLSVVNS
jgi:hypothetical protein